MSMIDPTYIRTIYDGLLLGTLHKDNASALPMGLVGMYEEALPPASNVNERKKFLDFFSVWALLKKEVSVVFLMQLLEGWTEEDVFEYISQHSKWFTLTSGKYLLYHENLRSYFLLKITNSASYNLNKFFVKFFSVELNNELNNELYDYAVEHLSSHFYTMAMQNVIYGKALQTLINHSNFEKRQYEFENLGLIRRKSLNEVYLYICKHESDRITTESDFQQVINPNSELLNRSITEINYQRGSDAGIEVIRKLSSYSKNWFGRMGNHKLPIHPPPEVHPYSNLHPINPAFQKYIISIFPPINYFADSFTDISFWDGKKLSKTQLPFYHGNRQMLWKYLLPEHDYNLLSEDRLERRNQIINYLNENRINYADVISFCQRAEYNADDANLFNIILNKQLLEIATRKSDEEILLVFNTGSLFTARGLTFYPDGRINTASFVFDMFIALVIEAGIEVQIQFQNQQPIALNYLNRDVLSEYSNIIRFDIYLNGKRIKVVAGPSPADGDGQLRNNAIYQRFERIFHANDNLSFGIVKKKFKKYVYETALLGDCDYLYELNYD